jgi:hypothetical protein
MYHLILKGVSKQKFEMEEKRRRMKKTTKAYISEDGSHLG